MKVKVSESNLGVEYISDVVSSCEQNGVECIVDDSTNTILFYDPRSAKYGTNKLLENSDVSIFDALQDKNLFNDTMMDANGEHFKEFAVQWNSLQKKEDGDDVFKTRHCRPIHGEFVERRQKTVTGKEKADFAKLVSKFRDRWHALDKKDDDDGLTDADRAHLERLKNTRDEFGDRVNGIEARVSESSDLFDSEGEVEIMWDTDEHEDFGIFRGDCSTYLIDYDRVDTHDDLLRVVCMMISKEYPDLDFEPDDFEIANEKEFWSNRISGKELADGCTEIAGIPDWATEYLAYGDASGLSKEDKRLVDEYVAGLASEGLALANPILGTEVEYDPHPEFGKACSTSTWIANEI